MEKRKRGRPPGYARSGGRKPGTKNRVTVEQKDRALRILTLIESEYLEDDIKNLSSNARVTLYKDTMDFVQPRMQRISHEGNDVLIINVTGKTINENSNQLAQQLGRDTSQNLLSINDES